MGLPPGYHEQGACSNCKHVYTPNRYEDDGDYRCAFGLERIDLKCADERESAHSVALLSPGFHAPQRAYEERLRDTYRRESAWRDSIGEDRQVVANGKCEKYEREEE